VGCYDEIHGEQSANGKVAIDAAIGAAYAGKRSMAAIRSAGINVAADSPFYAVHTGVRAGLVIVVADDPRTFSSQNEQDNCRYGH
jgi:indolepyruvate ferredoxin oxidoreductase alpha subunit